MRGSRELIFYAMYTEFTHDPAVVALTKTSLQIGESGKKFSDVIDGRGLQYVDLVQEGGAVLGIALVGYTYILEKAGIRFFSLAGTSAGAINAMLIAGLAPIGEPVSEKIIDAVTNVNFRFRRRQSENSEAHPANHREERKYRPGPCFQSHPDIPDLKAQPRHQPGQGVRNLDHRPAEGRRIITLEHLLERREKMPAGLHFTGKDDSQLAPDLAIISSEITTHTKAEFPRMAGFYWKDPRPVPPALFVRASMSIPFFYAAGSYRCAECRKKPRSSMESHGQIFRRSSSSGPVCRWRLAFQLPHQRFSQDLQYPANPPSGYASAPIGRTTAALPPFLGSAVR